MLTLRTATRRQNPSVSGFCGTFPLGFERQSFVLQEHLTQYCTLYYTFTQQAVDKANWDGKIWYIQREAVEMVEWVNAEKQQMDGGRGGRSFRLKALGVTQLFATVRHSKVQKCWTSKSNSGWEIWTFSLVLVIAHPQYSDSWRLQPSDYLSVN